MLAITSINNILKYTLVVFISIVNICCTKKAYNKGNDIIDLIHNKEQMIVIPVMINGNKYNFIWDTGCESSHILQSVVDAEGIGVSDNNITLRAYQQKQDIPVKEAESTDLKLGNIDISASFLIRNTSVAPMDSVSGIIGQDIINLFYWYFDWTNNKVNISSEPLISTGDPTLTLAADTTTYRLPYIDLMINDTIKHTSFIDTGMRGVDIKVAGKWLSYDFLIFTSNQASLNFWEKLMLTYSNAPIIAVDTVVSGRVFDSVKINDFWMDKTYVKIYSDDFYKELNNAHISLNFFKRFSQMYYDPFNNTIKLYIDPNDKKIYTGRNIDIFLKSY